MTPLDNRNTEAEMTHTETGKKAKQWLALIDLAKDKLRRRFLTAEEYRSDLSTLWRGAREDGPLVEAYLMDLIRIRLGFRPVNYGAALKTLHG